MKAATCLGGSDAVADVLRHGIAAACVMTAGACAAALALSASYAVSRQLF